MNEKAYRLTRAIGKRDPDAAAELGCDRKTYDMLVEKYGDSLRLV